MKHAPTLISILMLLSACDGREEAGGLTAEDSRKLNEAEAMLDEQPPHAQREP